MKGDCDIKKLGDVCDVINGLWTGKKEPFINICVIRNTNFTKDCKLNLDDVAYIDAELKQFSTRKLQVGDIIVEKSGGSDKQPVGRVVLFDVGDGDYSFSNFTSALRVKGNVDPKYLHKCLVAHYFRGETEKLQSKTTGIRNLDMKGYLRLPIPVPPLAEQMRIVAELDCLSGVIEKQKQQLKELDNLAESIFHATFGDPTTNNLGWKTRRLADVCHKIGDGLHGTPNYDSNGSVAFINGNNLIDGHITITDKTLFVNDSEAQKNKVEMGENTILLSINGTLGRTAIYRGEKVILGKSACYCNLNSEFLSTEFVEYLMKSQAFRHFLDKNSSKSTIKNVGLKAIRDFRIILPPIELQKEFVIKTKALKKQKELIRESIVQTEQLFNSRMDYFFN